MAAILDFSVYPVAEVLSFHETRAIWQEAERLGYAAVWHEDNLFPHPTELLPRTTPILDCWTSLAALAASTSTIRFGSMVSPAPRRHPALLAKAASTVDRIGNGRLTIGIGAGDPTTVEHYEQWGLPFPGTPKERVALLREHLEVQRLLYTEEVADYEGEFFRLAGAVNEPKPLQRPHPPIWLGLNTSSTVMPRVAARSADGIVVEWGDDAVAAEVVPRLTQACEAIGRDVEGMTKARFLCLIVTDGRVEREEAFRILAARSKVYERDLLADAWDVWLGSIVGTPEQIREELPRRTTDLGFDHVMCFLFGLDVEETGEEVGDMAASFLTGMRVVAREVMPAFAPAPSGD